MDSVVVCTILEIMSRSLDPTDIELSMEVANEALMRPPSISVGVLCSNSLA